MDSETLNIPTWVSIWTANVIIIFTGQFGIPTSGAFRPRTKDFSYIQFIIYPRNENVCSKEPESQPLFS